MICSLKCLILLAINRRLDKISEGKKKELIWILEHQDVYTAGTSYNEKEIIDKSIKFIKTNGKPMIWTPTPKKDSKIIIKHYVFHYKSMQLRDIAKHQKTIGKTTFCSLRKSSSNTLWNLSFIVTLEALFAFWFQKQKTGFLWSNNLVQDEAHSKAVFLKTWSGVDLSDFEVALKRWRKNMWMIVLPYYISIHSFTV